MRAQWAELVAQRQARLLVWRVAEDERRMVDAFIELGNDARAGDEPEVFLPLAIPFGDPARHGFALREALVAAVAEGEASLGESQGEDPDGRAPWAPPPVAKGADDVSAFAACAASLAAHWDGALERLVVVLGIDGVSDVPAFQLWLQRAAHRAPPSLRLLVLDTGADPPFDALARGEPTLVQARALDLDMDAALEETSLEAGRLDTPGGKFRHLVVQIGRAASAGEHARADALGNEAVTVMRDEPSLVAAVHFTLASMHVGASHVPEAVARFRRAEAAAVAAGAAGDPTGKPLAVSAAVGAGSALLAGEAWEPAASAFEAAAVRARAAGDTLRVVDCKRMAGFALERGAQPDRAWVACAEALAAGEALSAEDRACSTLRYAGLAMLRLARAGAGSAGAVEARMAAMLGPGWRDAQRDEEARR